MAIALDATGSQLNQTSVAALSWSHTCTGSDRVLFVGVAYQSGAGTTCTATYNSVSMTQIWNKRDDLNVQSSVGFVLIAPATGANTVAITLGATVDAAAGGSVSLTGVDQSTAHRTVYTNNEAGGGSPNVTVVDSQSGDWVLDCAVTFAATIAVGTSQTSRVENDAISGGGSSFGISTETAAGGNTAMTWTGGSFWATGATAFFASGGGGGRASKNIRAFPLGMDLGMGLGIGG